jgi:hypothetical protein
MARMSWPKLAACLRLGSSLLQTLAGSFFLLKTTNSKKFRSSSRNVQSTVIDLGLAWLTTYLIPAKRLEVSCVLFLS